MSDFDYLEAFPFGFESGKGKDRIKVSIVGRADHIHVVAREAGGEPQVTGLQTLHGALALVLRGAFSMVAEHHPAGWELVRFLGQYQLQWCQATAESRAITCLGNGKVH